MIVRHDNELEVREVETSSLVIEMPSSYEALSSAFTFVRYALPEQADYDEVHMALRNQLTSPYRVWWRDPLGRSVYALWPSERVPQPFEFGGEQIAPDHVAPDEIPFHMLVKLLMAHYFRGQEDVFTGQGKHYQFVRHDSWRDEVICLEFDLAAAKGVEVDDPVQLFDVLISACRFKVVSPDRARPARNSYYARTIGDDGISRMQLLTRSEAERRLAAGEPLWELGGDSRRPARLDFFNLKAIEKSRGFLLQEFCHRFAALLNSYGISAQPQARRFTRYLASKPMAGGSLDIALSGRVFFVLDQRHQRSVPSEYYIRHFRQWFPECDFTPIEDVSLLPETHEGPTIVLLDAPPEAYKGPLPGDAWEDPYQRLYAEYPGIPLQSFVVNPNIIPDFGVTTPETYLSYNRWTADEESKFEQRAQLTLRDAFLKHLILRELPLSDALPKTPALQRYAFVYRGLYNGDRYTAMMYVVDNKPVLRAVMDPEGFAELDEVCERYGLKWDDVEDALDSWRRNPDREYNFKVVLGQGVAAELVDLPEYALHEFQEIHRRVRERNEPQPTHFFLALPHFDTYAASRGWPTEEQISSEHMEEQIDSLRGNNARAVRLLQQLRRHDAFIEELAESISECSFEELWHREDYQELLYSLFGTRRPRTIHDVFAAGDRLLSPRQNALLFYTGIWYDEANMTYMVGSPDPIKPSQSNAHRLRSFRMLVGDSINLEDMLQLMAVGFVRLRQYTVLPYPFKLIRLYIENYLSWAMRA